MATLNSQHVLNTHNVYVGFMAPSSPSPPPAPSPAGNCSIGVQFVHTLQLCDYLLSPTCFQLDRELQHACIIAGNMQAPPVNQSNSSDPALQQPLGGTLGGNNSGDAMPQDYYAYDSGGAPVLPGSGGAPVLPDPGGEVAPHASGSAMGHSSSIITGSTSKDLPLILGVTLGGRLAQWVGQGRTSGQTRGRGKVGQPTGWGDSQWGGGR